MLQSRLKVDAMVDAAPEGEFVRIFEFITDGDPARDDGDLDACILEHAVDVEVGRVPLHRRTEGKEHLLDTLTTHTVGQVLEIKVGWTYAVEGRDDPSEDVIQALEVARTLYGDDLADALHDTYHRLVSTRICTYLTHLLITDVVAHLTVADAIDVVADVITESVCERWLLLEQVQRQTKPRLGTYPRQ